MRSYESVSVLDEEEKDYIKSTLPKDLSSFKVGHY